MSVSTCQRRLGANFDDDHDLGAERLAVLARRDDQVVEHLAHHLLDVGRVDELVDQLERALADRDVGVLEAVDDRRAVALHGRDVLRDDGRERVERDVADVVVAEQERPAEMVTTSTSRRSIAVSS